MKRKFSETEAIHDFFELTYAQFLVLSRTALQSMPEEWQARFVKCLYELDEEIDWRPEWPYCYHVTMRNHRTGQMASLGKHDPLGHYNRGRTRIELKSEMTEKKDTVCRVNGKLFRCDCGCNVFRKLLKAPLRYRCNSCRGIFEAEE